MGLHDCKIDDYFCQFLRKMKPHVFWRDERDAAVLRGKELFACSRPPLKTGYVSGQLDQRVSWRPIDEEIPNVADGRRPFERLAQGAIFGTSVYEMTPLPDRRCFVTIASPNPVSCLQLYANIRWHKAETSRGLPQIPALRFALQTIGVRGFSSGSIDEIIGAAKHALPGPGDAIGVIDSEKQLFGGVIFRQLHGSHLFSVECVLAGSSVIAPESLVNLETFFYWDNTLPPQCGSTQFATVLTIEG